MGQVVRLAERLPRRSVPRRPPSPLGANAYYCTRCETDRFLLYPNGRVQCAGCGARMDNLAVGECAGGAAETK